jgi:hypothetical protein
VTPPRRRYPTDLTDAQWALLAPLIPVPRPGGRPAIHDRLQLVNAMLYWLRAGCAWRLLPHDFPSGARCITTGGCGGGRGYGGKCLQGCVPRSAADWAAQRPPAR